MRRLLLFTLFVAVTFGLNAQTVFFNEPFDSMEELPAGWINIDADGDTEVWYEDYYEGDVLETYAVSRSWNEVPLEPDNYLSTPQIDLRNVVAPVILYWTIGVGDEEWPAEKYQVNISTTTPTVEGFSNPLFEEILEADAYYWNKRQIDISSYAGQQVYIAWRHYDCTDNYKLLLDSVKITVSGTVNTSDITPAVYKVYPNPASDHILINYANANRLVISNLLGEIVLNAALVNQQRIDISKLRKGLYFVSFYKNESLNFTGKLIKK